MNQLPFQLFVSRLLGLQHLCLFVHVENNSTSQDSLNVENDSTSQHSAHVGRDSASQHYSQVESDSGFPRFVHVENYFVFQQSDYLLLHHYSEHGHFLALTGKNYLFDSKLSGATCSLRISLHTSSYFFNQTAHYSHWMFEALADFVSSTRSTHFLSAIIQLAQASSRSAD